MANGTTGTNAITSTAATTTAPGDLIFGAVMDDSGVNDISAGTGFVQRQSVNNKDLASEDQVQGFAGLIAATNTFNASHRYMSIMGAFKAALVPDTTPPVITGVAVTSIGGTSATIKWTTNETADSQVEYGLTTSYGSTTTLNPTLVTSHTVSLTGLTASTTYHYRIRSTDASGNLSLTSDSSITTMSSNAPVISGVTVTSLSATSATIQWTTNTASDSQVEYGLTTSYGSATTLDPAFVTLHSVAITGLTESTTYH